MREIGYEQAGFHWKNAEFQFYVHEQSADIAMGVDADDEDKRTKAPATRASCSAMPAARPSR